MLMCSQLLLCFFLGMGQMKVFLGKMKFLGFNFGAFDHICDEIWFVLFVLKTLYEKKFVKQGK